MRRLASRPAAALSLVLAVAVPGAALADDWSDTFPAEAAASYFGGGSVLVAASGQGSVDLGAAARALEASLRASESIPLVIDGKGLGDLSDLGDEAIVQKASHLPVTRIAVVRVFAGTGGQAPSALVTIYGKDGAALAGFSAKRGAALAASAETAGAGVNRGVAEAVSTFSGDSAKSRSAAAEEYDKSFIWFQDLVAINIQNGGVVGSTTIPYQGKYKKPLAGSDFYEAIDRPDLASSYQTRQIVRWSLMGVGYAGLIGGALYPVLATDDCSAADLDCDMSSKWITGGVIMGGGLVLAVIGGAINPHPIEATEARRLADEHNGRLKERLGLTSRAAEPIRAGLFATRDGAGLSVGGAF